MTTRRPGHGLIRLLRAPARLYDWRMGWMLGHRFLRLTHVGRRSGRIYQTVLEVVGQNRATNELIVIAGLGRSAQWYRNLQAHEAIEVAIAGQRFTPVHRELSASEAAAVLADYERPQPLPWSAGSAPTELVGRVALRRHRISPAAARRGTPVDLSEASACR